MVESGPKLLAVEIKHWLERGHGTFWYIKRKDGFDVYLVEVEGAKKVTR